MARAARVICGSGDLVEAGAGARFDWKPAGGAGKAFAVRHGGVALAYVNRCPHLGVELDWLPGEFFEESGLYLICSTHGAIFEPSTGLCVAGPCRGSRLEPITLEEREGTIFVQDDIPEPVSADGSPNCP